MTTHHYELPEKKPSPWGRLSVEATTALTRVAMGPSVAKDLLGTNTPNAAAQGIESLLNPEVLEWAKLELDNDSINGALNAWRQYEGVFRSMVPKDVAELLRANPDLATTLNRLYAAKQALVASGEVTPGDSVNVGESMRLLVMPWQAISDHLADFDEWLIRMRFIQNFFVRDDIHKDLLAAIWQDQPLYRDGSSPSDLLTPTEYLTQKIEQDGPWGLVLVQNSEQAGLKSALEDENMNHSPDAMTNNGADHFMVADQAVDSMGIFEWLCLTLQEDPFKFSEGDESWMLANHVESSSASRGARMPYIWLSGQEITTGLDDTCTDITCTRPRLLVM